MFTITRDVMQFSRAPLAFTLEQHPMNGLAATEWADPMVPLH